GETLDCSFLLGEGASRTEAAELIRRYSSPGAVDEALAQVTGFWQELLSGIHIETPVPAFDLMVNGWLGYQTLSCRLWGRTAFYQSGGAFGFRDQLQDSLALMMLDPQLARRQIVLHAAHQFPEGDVLHWWHPGLGGIRTRFADDLLWLPWAAALYVQTTADASVLDASAPYVDTDRTLAPG